MTSKERKELGNNYEKRWYHSKKFLAFLLMELLLAAMSMVALFTQQPAGWPLAAFMTGIVVTMGSIALTFNGYQAKLDMYVRGMALTGDPPKSLMDKLLGRKEPQDPDDEDGEI